MVSNVLLYRRKSWSETLYNPSPQDGGLKVFPLGQVLVPFHGKRSWSIHVFLLSERRFSIEGSKRELIFFPTEKYLAVSLSLDRRLRKSRLPDTQFSAIFNWMKSYLKFWSYQSIPLLISTSFLKYPLELKKKFS